MGTGGYKIRNKGAIHFLSFAVVDWLDMFTRPAYQDIVLDSLTHCQQNRGRILDAWCLMTNHLHVVVSAKHHDLSEILVILRALLPINLLQPSGKTITKAEKNGCFGFSKTWSGKYPQ